MHSALVRPDGSSIRWTEIPGVTPTRVFLHGLGAAAATYYAATAAHPMLIGHRTLLMDLLGFATSDRPEDFAYTLEDHADALAIAFEQAGTGAADVVAHSMGGAVAIVLAARHPHLVRRLVLVDANLVASTPSREGGSGVATYTEQEFLADGWDETLTRVGPHWAATMRLAGKVALHRTAVHLARGSSPMMRDLLLTLDIPRTFLHPVGGEPHGGAPEELVAAGVSVVAVPGCGHNIMLDNPDAFAEAVAYALG